MKYRYLLFDADNTLFDFDASERAAFREMIDSIGVQYSDALYDVYHAKNAQCWKMLERGETTTRELRALRFAMLFDEADIRIGLTPAEVSARYEERLGRQNILLPGALETVRTLAKRYTLLLITNGFANIQRGRFETSQIRPYFKEAYISEEIGHQKPERAYFDAVLAKEHITDRAECLVIGDSLTADIDGAIGAGIDCCWISDKADTGGRCVQYHIQNITELTNIL